MKVYIDLENLEDITNNALLKISRKNCKPEIVEIVELQSLAEHDKKVRKEVYEEIRKEYSKFDDLEKFDWQGFEKFLNQIQGEKK